MATARFDFHGPTFQIAWAVRGAAEQDQNEAWEFSRIGGWPARMLRSIENIPRALSASLTMPCVGRVGSQSVREICFRRWLVVELRTLAVAKRSDPACRLAWQFCSAPAAYRLGEFSPAYATYVSVNLAPVLANASGAADMRRQGCRFASYSSWSSGCPWGSTCTSDLFPPVTTWAS
jgi:hypothetical protein